MTIIESRRSADWSYRIDQFAQRRVRQEDVFDKKAVAGADAASGSIRLSLTAPATDEVITNTRHDVCGAVVWASQVKSIAMNRRI